MFYTYFACLQTLQNIFKNTFGGHLVFGGIYTVDVKQLVRGKIITNGKADWEQL
jgi:hypothetical protein